MQNDETLLTERQDLLSHLLITQSRGHLAHLLKRNHRDIKNYSCDLLYKDLFDF